MKIKKVRGHEVPPVESVADKNPPRPGQDQYDKNRPACVVKISPEARSKQQREEEFHPKKWYEKWLGFLYK